MLQQLKRTVRRSLRTLVTVVAVLVVVVPAAAWAGHQFTDVPNSNVFHDDIGWMADNAVTKGCNPQDNPPNSEYCPDDFVTREQMAAFMHRLETEGVFAPADHEHAAMFGAATSETSSQHTTVTTFTDLSGASTTVEVPTGHEATIVGRFSAESACYGTDGRCSVRLLVNGTEMQPDHGFNYAFDTSDGGTEGPGSREGHAMERLSATLPSGTYTVTVQIRTTSGPLTFWLDDWALVAEVKLTS